MLLSFDIKKIINIVINGHSIYVPSFKNINAPMKCEKSTMSSDAIQISMFS